MKIRVRDADVPGNQAIRSNLDLLVRHDERAIEQCEIANGTLAIFADGKRTTGVTRNMFADNHGARFFALKSPTDLRALAIESLAKLHIWWNRIRPPVAFDASIFADVTQCTTSVGNFPDAYSFA